MDEFFFAITFTSREFIQEIASWIAGLDASSPMAFGAAAVAGLVMGLTPSTLPLVPVVVGYVIGREDDRDRRPAKARGLALSVSFVLGMATVDAAIGALFGVLGYYVVGVISEYLGLANLLIAALLALLGLALLRKVSITWPVAKPVLRKTDSLGGAYLLGIPFGLSVCPACTPLVLPILGIAAATASAWVAASLLFTFGLGRGAVVIVAGTAAGAFKSLERSARWVPLIERTGGTLLLITASIFLYQSAMYTGIVPPFGLLF